MLVFFSLLCFTVGVMLFYLTRPQPEIAEVLVNNQTSKQISAPISLQEIPLVDLKGNVYTLSDWTKPVLIANFWAPWCVPCRREIPALITLQNEFSSQVQILGLVFDSVENATSFEAEHKMNYPSFLAGNQISMYSAAFGNSSGALPFTAIIDQERNIRYKHTGEISLEKLREELSKIL